MGRSWREADRNGGEHLLGTVLAPAVGAAGVSWRCSRWSWRSCDRVWRQKQSEQHLLGRYDECVPYCGKREYPISHTAWRHPTAECDQTEDRGQRDVRLRLESVVARSASGQQRWGGLLLACHLRYSCRYGPQLPANSRSFASAHLGNPRSDNADLSSS